jgi:rubrerythrin
MAEKKYSDPEKLQLLIDHWLQHNRNHGVEYQKWAEMARQAGLSETAELIKQAIVSMEDADKALAKALASVGGPTKEHQHHQQHHHHHD